MRRAEQKVESFTHVEENFRIRSIAEVVTRDTRIFLVRLLLQFRREIFEVSQQPHDFVSRVTQSGERRE